MKILLGVVEEAESGHLSFLEQRSISGKVAKHHQNELGHLEEKSAKKLNALAKNPPEADFEITQVFNGCFLEGFKGRNGRRCWRRGCIATLVTAGWGTSSCRELSERWLV